VLGEAVRVLDLMRESKEWQATRALSAKIQKGERRTAFKAVRARFDFRSSMTDRYAIQRRERERRLAAERKRAHGELANRIVGQGNVVKISYAAFQKSFGRSVKVRAPGGLVGVIRQKTAATGGDLVEFPTRTTRLRVRSHDRYLHEEASLPAGPCARGWIGRGAARPLQRLPGALR